ncbi:MAG: FHA domain-containing protein [Acidimicrobiales bacterium]
MTLASTSYAAVIRPLQLLVMVIVLLFFLRVLRVAAVQARPVEGRGTRRRRRGPLVLEFVEPRERAGERVEVEGAVVVGRGSDCDITIGDSYLSTRHARFARAGGALSIEDLNSTNGTFVNDRPVRGRLDLSRGDRVRLGSVLLQVVR